MGKFSEHYKSVNESYFKHLLEAIFISLSLVLASIACLIHAVLPFAFKSTASNIISKILDRTNKRRNG